MPSIKYKEINNMSRKEREEKIKELKIELVKSQAGSTKIKLKPKEIKKTIAKILQSLKQTKISEPDSDKKSGQEKLQKSHSRNLTEPKKSKVKT